MSIDIQVPTLGESVTEATVAKWLKKKGDAVAADEPLVELETDKVTLEVNAPEAGVLTEILVEEGEDVEVGALLARLGEGTGAGAAPAAAPVSQEPARQEADPAQEAPDDQPAATAPARSQTADARSAASGASDAVEITVPPLGESVAEATVLKWLKREGDQVTEDEPLVELETDKVTLEVNAPAAGILSKIEVQEGQDVEVGALLGRIGAGEGAAPQEGSSASPAAEKSFHAAEKEPQAASGGAREAVLDPTKVTRSGEGGSITAEDLRRFLESASSSSAMTLSPAVLNL